MGCCTSCISVLGYGFFNHRVKERKHQQHLVHVIEVTKHRLLSFKIIIESLKHPSALSSCLSPTISHTYSIRQACWWNPFFEVCHYGWMRQGDHLMSATLSPFLFLYQMSAYLEGGRTTRLSSTETSRSRSSQEDFLCGEPPAAAAEPQYHPGPLGGGTTHSGRKAGGSNSSDVQYRCDPVEVCDDV